MHLSNVLLHFFRFICWLIMYFNCNQHFFYIFRSKSRLLQKQHLNQASLLLLLNLMVFWEWRMHQLQLMVLCHYFRTWYNRALYRNQFFHFISAEIPLLRKGASYFLVVVIQSTIVATLHMCQLHARPTGSF